MLEMTVIMIDLIVNDLMLKKIKWNLIELNDDDIERDHWLLEINLYHEEEEKRN